MAIQDLAEKLIREGEKIELFFLSLTDSQLEIFVYLDEHEWQIKDVLSHFISAEKSFKLLFENIRNGGLGAPEEFSINDFNNLQVNTMKQMDPAGLMNLFRETRADTVNWIKGVSEDELKITGRHPAMGESSLGEMIKMIYLHNQIHLRDIKAAINLNMPNDLSLID